MPQLSPIFWSFFPIIMFLVVMISLSILMCFSVEKQVMESWEGSMMFQSWCW